MKINKSKIILAINVIIMIIIVAAYAFNSIFVSADNNDININIVNNENGTQSFSYEIEGVTYENTNASIPKNTKIKLKAQPKDGYRFIYWVYELNDSTRKLSEKSEVSVTVKLDYEFNAVYIKEENFMVTFYSSEKKDIILGYEEVISGGSATEVEHLEKKGYSADGWDVSITNITNDTDAIALYKASVWSVFRDYYPDFFKGLGLTLAFSIVSVFFALFLGAVLCLARISKVKPLSIVSGAYIEIVRGVPLLLQLLLIYSLMPRIDYGKFINSEILAAILALFLNSGAYVAEIFRSGIQAVDKGQTEAGRALGLSSFTTMRKIVIPQAIKNVLPSIGNELIAVIKETSLASTVDASIGELMSIKKQITSASFINIPPFIVIAVMYFAVTFSLSKLVRYIERRLEARD